MSEAVTRDDIAALHELSFEGALDGMILHDHGRILACNAAASRILKRQPDEIRDKHLTKFIAAPDREMVIRYLLHPSGSDIDVHVLGPDGKGNTVQLHARNAREGRGIVVVRDLASASDGRKRQDRVAERDAELQRLEQMNHFKTQLLNTAAHELNTPLTPLRLQVHLLRSQNLGALSERQVKAVSVLERNVERLALLVSDILDVARLESGHLAIEPQDISLRELAVESIQSYEETARGVGIDLSMPSKGEAVVRADPRRILQVLYNLVSNGIKFTPEGGRVTIHIGEENGQGILEIRDTGLGMDESQVERLFQPFSRVHDTEGTAIPGTGLGLYITKGIIEQHGGTMQVQSAGPGKGTTFRVSLPLANASTPSPRVEPRPKSPLVAGPLAQRLRELI